MTVEVTTEGGTATGTVNAAAVSPAFFVNSVDGKQIVAALFAGTAVYVAREGAFPGISSRPAKPGDYLELYANGLGPTLNSYPSGQVLAKPYRLAAADRVKVTIGGVPATVQDINMTYAGLYQVNIQVPPGVPAGDQAAKLTILDRSTQDAVFLPVAAGN